MYSSECSSSGGGRNGCTSHAISTAAPLSQSAFRIEEKKYKFYKAAPPQAAGTTKRSRDDVDGAALTPTHLSRCFDAALFRDVVDFGRPPAANSSGNAALMRPLPHPDDASAPSVFAFDGVPGLFFLPQLLPLERQQFFARRALEVYSRRPYPNNLRNLDPSRVDDGGYTDGMRWATLGLAYDWTKKAYKLTDCAPMPQEIASVSRRVVAIAEAACRVREEDLPPPFGAHDVTTQGYAAQSSIVNYFPVGSMMMAHQDVSEAAMGRPLVSMSFGCSALFLMGTTDRDTKPFSFLLRSGDVVVFAGSARAAFHSVPRIFDDCPHDLASAVPAMRSLRVNINTRQVFELKDTPPLLAGPQAAAI